MSFRAFILSSVAVLAAGFAALLLVVAYQRNFKNPDCVNDALAAQRETFAAAGRRNAAAVADGYERIARDLSTCPRRGDGITGRNAMRISMLFPDQIAAARSAADAWRHANAFMARPPLPTIVTRDMQARVMLAL